MPIIEEEKPKVVAIYMPPDLRRKLEEEATKQLRSMSNLIVVILQRHFRAVNSASGASDGK